MENFIFCAVTLSRVITLTFMSSSNFVFFTLLKKVAECGKIRTRKFPDTETFYAVLAREDEECYE